MSEDNKSKLFKAAKAFQNTNQLLEARSIYGQILIEDPANAVSNHEIGKIELELGNNKSALNHFKKAISGNPKKIQHWSSYIETLVFLGRPKAAKIVIDQAVSKGGKHSVFEKLRHQIDLKIKPEIDLFEKHDRDLEIKVSTNEVIETFNEANKFMNQNELSLAITSYRNVIERDPQFVDAYLNMAVSQKRLGDLNGAKRTYLKALEIKPDYEIVICNLANLLSDQGELDLAIATYKKAAALNPSNINALFGMGITYLRNKQYEASIAAYYKILALDANHLATYNNIANAFIAVGDLNNAILHLKSAYLLNPFFLEARVNYSSLKLQIFEFEEINKFFLEILSDGKNPNTRLSVIEGLYGAIYNLMIGNIDRCLQFLKFVDPANNVTEIAELTASDSHFFGAYYGFLIELLKLKGLTSKTPKKQVFHLGDSHCLAFTGENITLDAKRFKVASRIIFGAKAFHFSVNEGNNYKELAIRNLNSIEKNSELLISFGEIDCRFDEGLIPAARKMQVSLSKLIKETVSKYVLFFINHNSSNKHNIRFINVPAPAYKNEISVSLNNEVAECVKIFNDTLQTTVIKSGLTLIDVYSPTRDPCGFSNGAFHCDGVHLDNRILSVI